MGVCLPWVQGSTVFIQTLAQPFSATWHAVLLDMVLGSGGAAANETQTPLWSFYSRGGTGKSESELGVSLRKA